MIHDISGKWALRVIDTKRLVEPCILRLKDLVNGLKLNLPDKAQQHIEYAYLWLRTFPAAAIVEHWDSQEAKFGTINELSKMVPLLILRRQKLAISSQETCRRKMGLP